MYGGYHTVYHWCSRSTMYLDSGEGDHKAAIMLVL